MGREGVRMMEFLGGFAWLVWASAGLAGLGLVLWAVGLKVIPADRIGVVEKWWSTKGSLDKAIIALNGEAGYQPGILRGGIHFRTPLVYRTWTMPLVTIPQGQIGYVFARDGQPLENGQTLGRVAPGNFQSVQEFLAGGGQKGPQRGIVREGTYAFNLAQFAVITASGIYYKQMGNEAEKAAIAAMKTHLDSVGGFAPVVIRDKEDLCGIVTVHDGPTLPSGEIIAPEVDGHNGYQDPESFLASGGFRGRQYQVLTEGTYFINRLFATVELIKKTEVPVGYAGVVVSYYGTKGDDMSGEEYKHGELVAPGHKGVWAVPLMPGKYAFNTYAGKVVLVPTTNIILKWISGEFGNHDYDSNLAEVGLITKDAFEPLLPLSVVIHIDYRKAPLVIQRFGDVKLLVEQTLDPMVGSYFKNQGQTKTLIELIQTRTEIQKQSTEDMRERFGRYNLELEEVLIGTPHAAVREDGVKSDAALAIESILKQLRDRQVADEQKVTYVHEREAAETRKALEEAQAVADMQKELTNSQVNITVQENMGQAAAKKAAREAEVIRVTAQANADEVRFMADAEATREAKVGIAKAIAIDEQVKAYGGPGFQVTQDVMTKVADAIKSGGMPIVPSTVVNMGGDGEGNDAGANAFGMFMTLLATDKLQETTAKAEGQDSPAVKAMKEAVMASVAADAKGEAAAKRPARKSKDGEAVEVEAAAAEAVPAE